MKNQLAKVVDKLNKKPKWIRSWLLDFALGSTIKFVGTAGINCQLLSQNKAVFKLKNKKKVRNHIGNVHAAAISLLAETASGLLLGMNVPDNKIPRLKSMKVEYLKSSVGDLTAVATISQQQLEQLHQVEKGDFVIEVEITDSSSQLPVQCEMCWAWVDKNSLYR